MDYKNAGVDIEAGYKSVELMKEHIRKTVRPEMLGGIGGFSGAFSMTDSVWRGLVAWQADDAGEGCCAPRAKARG